MRTKLGKCEYCAGSPIKSVDEIERIIRNYSEAGCNESNASSLERLDRMIKAQRRLDENYAKNMEDRIRSTSVMEGYA